MNETFEERVEVFRKELKSLCKKYYIVMDTGAIHDCISNTIYSYVILRDGHHRSDWVTLEQTNEKD